jgi:hypothetical protein
MAPVTMRRRVDLGNRQHRARAGTPSNQPQSVRPARRSATRRRGSVAVSSSPREHADPSPVGCHRLFGKASGRSGPMRVPRCQHASAITANRDRYVMAGSFPSCLLCLSAPGVEPGKELRDPRLRRNNRNVDGDIQGAGTEGCLQRRQADASGVMFGPSQFRRPPWSSGPLPPSLGSTPDRGLRPARPTRSRR